ncbi:MAG: hypothetical protein ABIO80_02050 [Sphingomicrobium sp.]
MRKLIMTLAAAGTALAVASPAAAQYYPQQQVQPYGYGAQQYGYNGYTNRYNGYGQAQNLQMRVAMVKRRIGELQRVHALRGNSAERLRKEARNIEHQLRRSQRYGMAGFAGNDVQSRLARLEQQVNYAASAGRYGGYGQNGYNSGYGNQAYGNQAYGDRNHDRDDRDGRGDDGDHDD